MKKFVVLLLSLIIVLTMVACGSSTDSDVAADYGSVQNAVNAAQNGEKLEGKTVKVVASQDSAAGMIYNVSDASVGANVYVLLMGKESNGSEAMDVKEGDTVVITVDSYDDKQTNYIYFYATEYKVY